MKKTSTLIALILITVHTAMNIHGQSAFTYQGRLQVSGANVTGLCDLQFALYNSQISGAQIGPVNDRNAIAVSNGSFTVGLDFGVGAFDGSGRWLQIGVKSNGSAGAFTVLSPRQQVTPAPEAIFAQTAGTVPAGSLTSTQLAAGAVTSQKIANGQVVRSINFLTENVGIVPGDGLILNTLGNTLQLGLAPANCLMYSNCYWNLLGNGNITPGMNFLGTVAGETAPLEFRVNNATAMRYEPSSSIPNIIGGYGGNSVRSDVIGAVIGGGGQASEPNVIESDFVTISGGRGNQISGAAPHSTIGGGRNNAVGELASGSTIGGGALNVFSSHGEYNTIGGGYSNRTRFEFWGPAIYSTIGGGDGNELSGMSVTIAGGKRNIIHNSYATTIGGGDGNVIESEVQWVTISGGKGNSTSFGADFATISGGRNNRIEWSGRGSTIGGGENNVVDQAGQHGTIDGGRRNSISFAAEDGTIGGGSDNVVGRFTFGSTISGGQSNLVSDSGSTIGGGALNVVGILAARSTISGGASNAVGESASGSSIGGGEENTIQNDSVNATIAGGHGNTIWEGSLNSTIAGGTNNSIGNPYGCESCTIGGGSLNRVSGEHNTVAGGYANYAGGFTIFAAIGGGRANQIGSLSANCTISGGEGNIIYSQAQSETIGGGEGNIIHADRSLANVIGGGRNNQIEIGGWSGTISGGESNRLRHITSHGSIGGGVRNYVGGNYGTVSGGKANTVDFNGHYGTIPGGRDNTAAREAFAAGTGAQALHQGAFVWSASDGGVVSTNENSVTMRASGGYRFFSDSDAIVGAHLASGSGSWTAMSDRNMKANLEAVSPRAVLEKVASLPVQRWNYKTQDSAVRHIGPTAQDFKAAFEVGESDTGISSVDADGVALAAIQGLNEKLEEQLRSRDAEIRELRAALSRLETHLANLTRERAKE